MIFMGVDMDCGNRVRFSLDGQLPALFGHYLMVRVSIHYWFFSSTIREVLSDTWAYHVLG